MLQLLQQTQGRVAPTAIICYNGNMARGAIDTLLREHYRVPTDFTVVAGDASRVCFEEEPIITNAGPSPEKLGQVAADLLLRSTGADEESFTDLVLASQLHLGETSATPVRGVGARRASIQLPTN